MAEEEDEVAVGMEKGFMDEFFEQVGSFNAPDPSLLQADGMCPREGRDVRSKLHSCMHF